jgi:hypothetical protein
MLGYLYPLQWGWSSGPGEGVKGTPVSAHKSTRCHIPYDQNPNNHRHGNSATCTQAFVYTISVWRTVTWRSCGCSARWEWRGTIGMFTAAGSRKANSGTPVGRGREVSPWSDPIIGKQDKHRQGRGWKVAVKGPFNILGVNVALTWIDTCIYFTGTFLKNISTLYECLLSLHSLFWKNRIRLTKSPCCPCNPPSKLLNAWSNLYETWYVYHGTWSPLNGVLHKHLPPVCLCT